MRYFDKETVANSKLHQRWWAELGAERKVFHNAEAEMARVIGNAAGLIPTDAWRDLDGITKRVMRDDEGEVYMRDLMPLAKPVNIGKLVHLSRVSSDAGKVKRSMSGQVALEMDKVDYDFQGSPVPIFDAAYGREWREQATFATEGFDALADDQEAHVAALRQDMAQFVLNGDASIKVQGYQAYGIKNSPRTKIIDLGASGANIDLTAAGTTSDAIDAFFTSYVGTVLDNNKIRGGINVYVSPEIGRNLDRSYSGSGGFKGGKLVEYLITNRRINKIEVTFELSGNEWFGFVPSSEYIRPLVGMAVGTVAMPRLKPRDNFQFQVSGALGIDIRSDFAGNSGVFYAHEVS